MSGLGLQSQSRSQSRTRDKYYLIAMGSLQQATVPVPPLVTMNSDPHFAQIYLLPVSLATCLLHDFGVKNHHRLPAMVCNTTMGNCHYRQRSKGIQLGWDCASALSFSTRPPLRPRCALRHAQDRLVEPLGRGANCPLTGSVGTDFEKPCLTLSMV